MPFDTETGNWTPPAQHLNNYTLTSRRSNWNTTEVWYTNPELLAYTCDQSDDCDGFAYDGGNEHKGFFYFKSLNGNVPLASKPIISYNGTSTYLKNSTTVRKANDPDTSDPSILPVGENTTSIDLYDQWSNKSRDLSACGSIDNTAAVLHLFHPGIISYQSTAPFVTGTVAENIGMINDRVGGYKIPIGWKFVFNASGNWFGGKDNPGHDNEGSHEFYEDRRASDGDYHGCFNMDDPHYYAMNDKMSSGIIENIGFDVLGSWDTMGSKGISSGDEQKIKERWCNSVTSLTTFLDNKDRCKATLGNEAYNRRLLTLCETSGTWTTDGSCKGAVRDSIGSGDGNHAQALTMIHKFCRGGDGSNPQGIGPGRSTTGAGSKLCGCLNANDFSFYSNPPTANCYTYPNMAGCSQVVQKTQDIVAIATGPILSEIKTNFSDAGSLAEDCVTSKQACVESETACVIPYQRDAAHSDVTINMCAFITQQNIAVNSAVSNKCSITTPGTPGAKTTTAATGPSAGSGSGSGSGPSSLPDTPILIGGGIAGCFCCILFIVIAFLLSSGN
jgi:hypothetical protein